MTYSEICQALREANIATAEWDAALLIEHFCGVDATLARMDPDAPHECDGLQEAVKMRAERYPLQYLLGEWAFYRQTYRVTPDCLIPRSDTEILVEEAIRTLPQGARFADLCTGSGCIAVSVLAERPDTTAVAVEKYPKTLELATQNAEKNAVSERFTPMLADVLEPLPFMEAQSFDAILSNPPYIATRELSSLSKEVQAEPSVALDGGEDGLIFYRRILELHTAHLAPDGILLLEIGYDQAASVLALGAEYGFLEGKILKDLGGNNRVAVFKKNKA